MSSIAARGTILSDTAIDSLLDLDGSTLEGEALKSPKTLVYPGSTCNYHSGYLQGGSSQSLCGLVALNCARLAFKSQGEGLLKEELLKRMLSPAMVNSLMKTQEIMNITNDLGVLDHTDLQDLLEVPIFQETFTTVKARYDLGGLTGFLSYWFPDPSNDVRAAILSNDAEVFVCLSIAIAGSHIFALFDSHAHTNNPRGPSFTVSSELDRIATVLRERLQASPLDPLSNNPTETRDLSAYVLKPIEGAQALDTQALVIRSVTYIQHMQWKSRASADGSIAMPSALSEHLALLRSRAKELKKIRAQESPNTASSNSTRRSARGPRDNVQAAEHGDFGWQLSLLRHVSTSPSGNDDVEKLGGTSLSASRDFFLGIRNEESVYPKAGSSRGSEFGWLTSIAQAHVGNLDIEGHHKDEASVTQGSTKGKDAWVVDLVKQIQEEEEIAATLPRHTSSEYTWLVTLQKQMQAEQSANSGNKESSSFSHLDLDWQLAVQLQQEDYRAAGARGEEGTPRIIVESEGDAAGPLNAESDSSRSHIRADLLRVPVPDWRGYGDSFTSLTLPPQPSVSFQCGICGEIHDLAEKLGPSDCGHGFCKECLTYFTQTKIEEGRYPVFCPECLAERSRANKCHITPAIIDKLSITPDELRRLGELELVSHSVSIECPRCKETMHVDRGEYAEQSIIICPLPRCAHKWCKSCHQTVASSEERHRCRHGNIDRMMKRKGWKYCPGCRTPVQKESGCNHMTCGAPGCNVHFCYKCGVLMIDTTNGGDVGTAVTDHYTHCRLFEKRLRCSIQ